LGEVSIKLRTCHKEYCEYSFEESFGSQAYPELKFSKEMSYLDLSLAAAAIFSTRAVAIFEPFPSFFLKGQEFRTKAGYLDNVKNAKQSGKDVSTAKKVDDQNKDFSKIMEVF